MKAIDKVIDFIDFLTTHSIKKPSKTPVQNIIAFIDYITPESKEKKKNRKSNTKKSTQTQTTLNLQQKKVIAKKVFISP